MCRRIFCLGSSMLSFNRFCIDSEFSLDVVSLSIVARSSKGCELSCSTRRSRMTSSFCDNNYEVLILQDDTFFVCFVVCFRLFFFSTV